MIAPTKPRKPGGSPVTAHAPLFPLLSVNFIGTLGFSIVLPFLEFLVTRWGGNALVYGAIGATARRCRGAGHGIRALLWLRRSRNEVVA